MATAQGHIWGPMTRGRDALSEVSAFQSWVDAADATAALRRIHLFEDRLHTDQPRFAVIMDGADFSLTRDTVGSGLAAFRPVGSFRIGLLEEVQNYTADNVIDFLNNVADITVGLLGHENASLWRNVSRFTAGAEDGALRWQEGERRGYQWYWTIQEAQT